MNVERASSIKYLAEAARALAELVQLEVQSATDTGAARVVKLLMQAIEEELHLSASMLGTG